jgi:hypothetical protein
VTRVTKKVVLSLDPETQAYKCAGHNLSSEQEAELTGKLKTEGRIFVSFDQKEGHHRALSFHSCKICRGYAEQATCAHRQAADRAQAEKTDRDKETRGRLKQMV